MDLRKRTKYAVVIIFILSASLINEYILGRVNIYYKEKSYLSVLIAMLVTVLVYVPLYTFLGNSIKRASKEYVKRSKKVVKNSHRGLLVGLFIALIILFVLFAKVRFNMDVINDIKSLL